MRKIITFFALILLFSGIAYADSLCTDTDSGKNYGVKGTAKYAITQKEDLCVISPSAEVRQDTSPYLKEYFCNKDVMDSEIIECIREGFASCEMGKCIGGTAEAKLKDVNYTPPPPEPECGNSVVDPGEDCDPMNKMCFDDEGNIGLCDANCKCEIKIKKDGTKTNTTEEENETEIKTETPVEKETETEEKEDAPVVVKPKDEEKITVEIETKPKEEKAPKGFFSKIWAWITGLFS